MTHSIIATALQQLLNEGTSTGFHPEIDDKPMDVVGSLDQDVELPVYGSAWVNVSNVRWTDDPEGGGANIDWGDSYVTPFSEEANDYNEDDQTLVSELDPEDQAVIVDLLMNERSTPADVRDRGDEEFQ